MSILDDLSEKLTLQQKLFCDEYLVSFNAYRAALSAGYSDSTARKAELLHMPRIQDYLKAAMNRTSERLQITHDMILRELAKVAFSNMGSYYDDNGVLKPMNELSEYEKAAICQYQVMDAVDDDGQRIGELSKIKLHNKMSALDKIARHLGFYSVEKSQEARIKKQESALVVTVAEESDEKSRDVCFDNLSVVGDNTNNGGEQEMVSGEVRMVSGELPLVESLDRMSVNMVIIGDNTNNGGENGGETNLCEAMQDVASFTNPSLHPPVGRESHIGLASFDVEIDENMKFVNDELQQEHTRHVCVSDNGVSDNVNKEPHPSLSKREGLKTSLVNLENSSAEAKKILTFSPQPPMRIFENRKAKERKPVAFLGKRANYSFETPVVSQR